MEDDTKMESGAWPEAVGTAEPAGAGPWHWLRGVAGDWLTRAGTSSLHPRPQTRGAAGLDREGEEATVTAQPWGPPNREAIGKRPAGVLGASAGGPPGKDGGRPQAQQDSGSERGTQTSSSLIQVAQDRRYQAPVARQASSHLC